MSGRSPFRLVSPYEPAGDQPEAIARLADGFRKGVKAQILEGVTGSGKTFTMANVIRDLGLPTLVLSHNKTLAAQLYGELKAFFPENAVEYFVSYYDYYQPEAYIPQTDTYIAKDSAVNDEIERFRLSAANALVQRRDVVVVASVSCIYGIGSSDDYAGMSLPLAVDSAVDRDEMLARLVEIRYERNDYDPKPGTFRVRGDVVDVFPAWNDKIAWRIELFGDVVDRISEFDPASGRTTRLLDRTIIAPARNYVLPKEKVEAGIAAIEEELADRVAWFNANGKLLEAQRLQQRTEYDLAMIREIGYCTGIENYSQPLSGRPRGTPGECLVDYFPKPFLTIIDESHATIPQLRAMYHGDRARKTVLVDNGFRLPSARDNRPLSFEEFEGKLGQVLFASATPGPYEKARANRTVEQVIRPTGLLDPPVEIRPLAHQIDDAMEEIRAAAARGDRVLVTALTKRTAEDLSSYLREAGLRVEYLHSDIDALERVAILTRLRRGEFDALVGVNLLREGLDLPEVALVAVLDADKEGFLRSTTSLVQTAGRTARHERGRVILYADEVTDSMREMIRITERRRRLQSAFNEKHGIVPHSVRRQLSEDEAVRSVTGDAQGSSTSAASPLPDDRAAAVERLKAEMLEAAEALEFERAALLRDRLRELQSTPPDKSP
ncbi:MAG: excinuclease ABC subunit UvrB [Kiritimatiellae bacterium]|nr:excinuclease ABC subunit UvrB [Kiritimatiellia bacterium]